jgi:hypothetical protein
MPVTTNSSSLVMYPAPDDDNVTFYIGTLTGTAIITNAGVFAGLETSQPNISYPKIITISGHYDNSANGGRPAWDTATVASYFRFRTSTSNDSPDNSHQVEIHGADSADIEIAFPSITQAATFGLCYNVGGGPLSVIRSNRLDVQGDYIDTLSAHVFGHRGAADLFSNQEAVKNAWDLAETAASGVANRSIDRRLSAHSGEGISESEQALAATIAQLKLHSASKELIENMMASPSNAVRTRFTLGYGATISSGPGHWDANTTYSNVPITSNSTTVTRAARLTIKTDADKNIHTIAIYNDPTDSSYEYPGVATGQGYAKGNNYTFTNPQGTGGTVTVSKINSVQVAILNGTMDSTTVYTEAPLESGDKIRVKLSIDSATGQLNARGSEVSFTQSYFIDYQMVGGNHTTA